MAELVGGKRKLNCKSIVQKYKILKEVEQGTSLWCGCKKIRHLKSNPL